MTSPRIYRIAVYQYFLFLAAFVLLPKNISQLIFMGEIAIFSLLFINHLKEIKYTIQQKDYAYIIPRMFFIFILVGITYLGLSYWGLADFWNIDGLFFEKKHIPRHFFIVAELIIPIGLSFALYKSDLLYHLSNTALYFIFIFAFSLRFFGSNPLHTCYLAVSSASLLAFRKNNALYLLLVAFVLVTHNAYLIASGIMWLAYIFKDKIINKFRNETHIKLYLILFIAAAFIYIFIESFMGLLAHDENTLWRWMVWTNETHSLIKTYFTGVGFGTAYVTSEIVNEVNNYNMYISFDDNTIYDRLFLVANHNSFLNMFYRMGILGGGLFLTLYFLIFRWTLCAYNDSDEELQPYIWWAFINLLYQTFVILFNPGLEMMQFAIQFIPSVAILLAILMKAQSPVIED